MTTTTNAPTDVTPGVPEDGAALLSEVRATLAKYVILPDNHAMVGVALWIAATHAVPAWTFATRLVIRAPEKRCGKSRLLQIVDGLSHAPLKSVNASPSAVYRSIAEAPSDPPTLLLDEADTIFGAKAAGDEDLRGLLNAGFERDNPALRYNAGIARVEELGTFSMAALAGIGAMPDTIEDRAVVIRMRRRAPGEKVAPYRKRRDGEPLDKLRVRLNAWIRANMRDLGLATPPMPVEDRAADLWEPLVAVADLAGGEWPDAARAAAVALTGERDANVQQSTQTRLLADCQTAFGDAEALPSVVLLERLKALEESPWATYGPNGLTPMRLGALLREFDITSKNLRLETGQAKGYTRSDFTDAWARYCTTEPVTDDAPAGGRPSQPSQPSHGSVAAAQGPLFGGTA
jgi:hypothetical protein